jgi:hypothetical protein
MSKKKKVDQSLTASNEDPKALCILQQRTETPADALAHTSLQPTVQAACTLMEFNKGFGEMSINTLVADLSKQCDLASEGDLERGEA